MSTYLLRSPSSIRTLFRSKQRLQSPAPSLLLRFCKSVSIAIIYRPSRGNCTTLRCVAGEIPAGEEDSRGSDINHSSDLKREGFWSKWKVDTAGLSLKLAKLGMAAVLAYGLFDAVTYTTFFVLAFLGYEKSTGKNPAANIQALLGIIILMWTGNNVTRPFRVAGAAALAPMIDVGLKKIQKYFKFSRLIHAFALVVSAVATMCFSIVGLLILSRWKGK